MKRENKTLITENDLKSKIKKTEFMKIGRKTTICLTTLTTGFEIITSSACVNENNFDYTIGKKMAYDKLINKLWELEGYLLQNNENEECVKKDGE
jgi:hypothetical protein